jgi:hypothetical protein
MDMVQSVKVRIREALCRLKWEVGQTTAEYALVLLAAAAVAMVLIAWARETDALDSFFDGVIGQVKKGAGIEGGK